MFAEQVWHARVGNASDDAHGSGGGHRRRLAGRRLAGGGGSGEELLSADELWTFSCNWLRDVIGVGGHGPRCNL